ncbi:hypothetical protein Ctob_011145, partial [Chrysochromulina tobinii]
MQVATGDANLAQLWRKSLAQLPLDGAVLFADDRAACALAWAVGLPALLDLGVCNVLRLGDRLASGTPSVLPGAGASSTDRAVVLCSSFLPEAYAALRTSLCHSGFRLTDCTIACTFSERAHREYGATAAAPTGALATNAYEACEAEARRWLCEAAASASGSPARPVPAVRVV